MSREGFFVLVDAPPSLDFGIDCMSYETGPKFSGVSLVPSGLHFIYHSTGMGSRMGFFLLVNKGQVVARQWDRSTEEIIPVSTLSEESLHSLERAIEQGELNEHLGPYPLTQHGTWKNLSNHISLTCLERIGCPYETNIGPGDDPDMVSLKTNDHSQVHPSNDSPRAAKYCNLEEVEKTLLKNLDSKNKAIHITSLYMDKTAVAQSLVESRFNNNWKDLLGELQISFLLFILLYSYPSLQHWKSLVATLCQCEELFHTKPDFSNAFIRILYEQLNFCPADFFETELSKNNFLRAAMSNLFEILNSETLHSSLLEHRKRFYSFLQKKFGLFEERSQSFVNSTGTLVHSEPFNLVEEDLPVFVESDQIPNEEEAPLSPDRGSPHQDERGAFEERLSVINAALDAVSEHRDSIVSQFDSEDIERTDFIGLTSSPISVALTEGTASAAPESLMASSAPLSRHEIETGLFCWRYPYLYDAMVGSEGREDLTMTAMRVIDEELGPIIHSNRRDSRLTAEARMFLEEEVAKRSRV